MKVDYEQVKQFALLYVGFQRLGRGDMFATASEMEAIKEDIFGWSPLWLNAFLKALGYTEQANCWLHVDHNKKEVYVKG